MLIQYYLDNPEPGWLIYLANVSQQMEAMGEWARHPVLLGNRRSERRKDDVSVYFFCVFVFGGKHCNLCVTTPGLLHVAVDIYSVSYVVSL